MGTYWAFVGVASSMDIEYANGRDASVFRDGARWTVIEAVVAVKM
jgi:hypothetical protein